MENFFRSLKYLWPYRKRLTLAIVCVLFIALLWGGGFVAMAPAVKVLLSEEGLHGWAWRSLADDKFDMTLLVTRVAREGIQIDGRELSIVLNIRDAKDPELVNSWIIGLDDGDPAHQTLSGDQLIRLLAKIPAGQSVTLRIFDHFNGSTTTVTMPANKASYKSELLGKIAGSIHEPADRPGRLPMFNTLLLIFGASVFLRNVFRFTQEYLVETAVRRGIMDLRCETFNNAIHLPATFYAASGTSDTTSRLFSDIGELARGQITLLGKTLVEPAKAATSIAAAFILEWRLTLITLIAGPPTVGLIHLFGRLMKKASRKALESSADLLETTEETLMGVRVVKAYTMEPHQKEQFTNTHKRLYKQQRRMARIDASTAPLIESLGVISGIVAAGIAGYYVFNGKMDPEIFIVWMACLAAMFDPMRKLSKVFTRFQRSEAAAKRVFDVYDQEPEKRLPGAPALARHKQSITFENVSLRYENTNILAVNNVNLTIHHNETVAIVGPNGCGKTTLVSMLPRLLEPTAGRVLVDGKDLQEVSLESLRKQIGLVTQDSMMFHATIAENIGFGNPEATMDAIIEAAKRAHVDEFVRSMPGGYETIIGQHGSTLSGGQKQRISIARAILRDPSILIFDEATSQIDAESEHRISQAVNEFMVGRTTLMIAHRFATVMAADRIAVMDGGLLLDTGKHAELIKRCELYETLYNTQFTDSQA